MWNGWRGRGGVLLEEVTAELRPVTQWWGDSSAGRRRSRGKGWRAGLSYTSVSGGSEISRSGFLWGQREPQRH